MIVGNLGTGKEADTRQLKSKEIIKTSTPSRLHLKKGLKLEFLIKKCRFFSEEGYKNKIDDENRYHTVDINAEMVGHVKTDDSDLSNDGGDDNYVVYEYVKNEKTGSEHEDSESSSKDQENDQERMIKKNIFSVNRTFFFS